MTAPKNSEQRKARGAFFTPPAIADFLARWAIRTPDATVLEPSCGEAEFLVAAGQRLTELGANNRLHGQLHGVELHRASAEESRKVMTQQGLEATIWADDFFDAKLEPTYAAVLGNPPFIRFQDYSGPARAKAQRAALAAGVRLSGLSNSWPAFLIRAAELLRPLGRLAMVIPAELLSVNYAAPVRSYLMDRFRQLRLVAFDERVFSNVLQDVVLLLGEGRGPTEDVHVARVENLTDLEHPRWVTSTPTSPSGKWTTLLLSSSVSIAYHSLIQDGGFVDLGHWGRTDLGIVTGNNRYFALDNATIRKQGIRSQDLLPISPPGTRQLRGMSLSRPAWTRLGTSGERAWLFSPRAPVSRPAARYISAGERQGVHTAYKCRNRTPWWRVPLVEAPDHFITYMSHKGPRLVRNTARVRHLNSLHGLVLSPGHVRTGRRALHLASLNSLTLLGSELVGRSYGGGVLKLEPREADSLPVPSPELVSRVENQLLQIESAVEWNVLRGKLDTAVNLVDGIVLSGALGISTDALKEIRSGRTNLLTRRTARAATAS